MKKRILLLAVTLLNMGLAFAQTHVLVHARHLPPNLLQQNPSPTPSSKPVHTQATALSATADRRQVGAYWGDGYGSQGYGLPQFPGTLRVATILPVEFFRQYEGCRMVALRTALTAKLDQMRFFVAPVDTEGNILPETASAMKYFGDFGWNEAEITPLTIHTDGLAGYVVGYEYTQINDHSVYGGYAAECYPVSLWENDVECPLLVYGDLSYGEDWYNVDTEGKTMSMQCIVEGSDFLPKDIALTALTTTPMLRSDMPLKAELTAQNFGTDDAASYDVDLFLDGQPLASLSGELRKGEFGGKQAESVLPSDIAAGDHLLTARLTAIDGTAMSALRPYHELTRHFGVYSEADQQQRQRYVVEELTSTASKYAPLGTRLLAAMKRNFDDFSIVSLHESYTGTDTLATADMHELIDLLNWKQTPSAAFNRVYMGSSKESAYYDISAGTGYDTQYPTMQAKRFHTLMADQSMDALARLSIDGRMTDHDITVSITGVGGPNLRSIIGDRMRLTVYLTEDGIVAPQLNGNSTDEAFVHDNVVRSLLTPARGDQLSWSSDDTFCQEYRLTAPGHWQGDRMHVTALLHLMPSGIGYDFRHMQVSNAESAPLTVNTAIVSPTAEQAEPLCYSIYGTRLPQPRRGISLVRMADGTFRKIVIR